MSCGVGGSLNSDLVLLWLWCRPAAVALIGPLAWEPPYASGMALRSKKNKQNLFSSKTEHSKLEDFPEYVLGSQFEKTFQSLNLRLLTFFFFFLATPMAYGSSLSQELNLHYNSNPSQSDNTGSLTLYAKRHSIPSPFFIP